MFARSAIDSAGFVVVDDAVPEAALAEFLPALGAARQASTSSRRRSGHSVRNLLEAVPEVQSLARSEPIRELVEPVLGSGAFVVRGILFDKTPEANWKVAWHQDLTIAVRERKDVAGFGPWSEKAGIPHVQPPPEVLERMLTARIHLDECGPSNGPLQVIPGSHRSGRLSPQEIGRLRAAVLPIACTTTRGGVVVMRPLILHASSPATEPRHRRVVHLEFAAEELPHGLQWHGRYR